ncbi:hypothetical protein D3C81_1693780 [compost metagenome]
MASASVWLSYSLSRDRSMAAMAASICQRRRVAPWPGRGSWSSPASRRRRKPSMGVKALSCGCSRVASAASDGREKAWVDMASSFFNRMAFCFCNVRSILHLPSLTGSRP